MENYHRDIKNLEVVVMKKELYIPVTLPWNKSAKYINQGGLNLTELTKYVHKMENKYKSVNNIPINSQDYLRLIELADKVTYNRR